ncbi:uncharacterized protein LOC110707181 [Chenopodium quinoa]|uniref:uncharacterized protein LOC110707181 n=1 Tax=Chenopodium quinoa TaxID=63459 RepID=UPI000B7934D0|nr:uncharacterized protein LOC110707181 [Chenopodium quinoa]
MCVDFTNLNRACPKDFYPLPRIDQLVDSTSGHALLSFMDAFSGYHQIFMHPDDRAKTAFVTSVGVYNYKMMPFGLKNAGATYQRLVDQVFAEQKGRNMEVYVDDSIVKSKEAKDHVADLAETFATLRKHQMKLNPKKYVFGVRSGKFLGFMVSKRGIDANPANVQAALDLPEPKTKRDIQRLMGRMAALSRFISKASDKGLPFFKALKFPKSKELIWEDEQKVAFQQLREHLANLPTLARPAEGEILYLYVAVSPATETLDEGKGTWTVFTDGSATVNGSGAGVVITSPEGKNFEYALKFSFKASNNEAEYEAAVAGLELCIALEAEHLNRSIYVEVRRNRSIDPEVEVQCAEVEPSWMDPILAYKLQGTLSEDKNLAAKMKRVASRFIVYKGELLKKSFSAPLLKCVGPTDADYILREIHFSICGNHIGGRTLAHKALRAGYYWPTMIQDAKDLVRKCEKYTQRSQVEDQKSKWIEELPGTLWSLRITEKEATGHSPFELVYGSEAILPVEIGSESLRVNQFSAEENEHLMKKSLDFLDEIRDSARDRMAAYKQRISKFYNRRVQSRLLKVGDLVLRNAAAVQKSRIHGKLSANWEGPYEIYDELQPGTYCLRQLDGTELKNHWNANYFCPCRFLKKTQGLHPVLSEALHCDALCFGKPENLPK